VTLLGQEPRALANDPVPPDRVVRRSVPTAVWLALTVAAGLVVRLIDLNRFGFNGDEAVYAGQAASLAGNPLYVDQFPVFRAHPLLLQTLMSPLFASGTPDLRGRVVVALLGVATVAAAYLVGRELYGPSAGVVGALLLALMPYHVVVTRQVLLDGPAVLWITLAFWMLARFVNTRRSEWLAASAATLGLGVLTKETSAVVGGSFILFLLLSAEVRRPGRAVALTLGVLVAVSVVFPLAIEVSHHKSTGQGYLTWQLTRSSTHAESFYLTTVAPDIGWLVLAAAIGALLLRVNRTWRELLLVLWAVVPVIVFELYPLKGYQYLLPAAPAVALLAGRGLTIWRPPARWRRLDGAVVRSVLIAVVVVSLLPGLWSVVFPSPGSAGLAGRGGIPEGRAAGKWVAAHLAPGTQLMAIGPSMANVIEYYSHRQVQGLSVSTNPLHRNPAYVPIDNPDLSVRDGQFQFLVWDAYSARRSPDSARRLDVLLTRYHAVIRQTFRAGGQPVIVIYEVHP
jgi:4-amino-4-deoxy-L-arabinose transferase-like glycosyltransferase